MRYGLNELSQSELVEVTDLVSNMDYTIRDAEAFNMLYDALSGTLIRGVAFAPVLEPMTLVVFGAGVIGAFGIRRRKGNHTTKCRFARNTDPAYKVSQRIDFVS